MKRSLIAAAAVGLLALTGGTARAQGGPDACTGWAAQASLPALAQSYAYTPGGYGPYGYGPLMQPFGNGPAGVAAYYGPPGTVAAYGPLGPGPTANQIAQSVLVPSGYNPLNPANVGTTIALAGLQQAELISLNGRYLNSAAFQQASATWANSYATQAATTFTLLQALCQNQPVAAPRLAAVY